MANRDSNLIKQHFNARIFKSYFDYVRDHYPHVDVRNICDQAGLDYEYLQNENNWVSCTFNLRLMRLLAESIRDPDFSKKVGRYSVSREGLGAALFNLGRNVFDLRYIYGNLWRLSTYLNKVMRFEVMQSGRQTVTLRLSPIFEGLDEFESAALKQLIPFVIQNTEGYYSALPRMKDMQDSIVEVKEASDSFALKVVYPAENFKRFEAAIVVAAAFLVSGLVELSVHSLPWAVCSFLFVISVYGLFFARRIVASHKATAQHLEANFDLVNQQYNRLQMTQEELDRKYLEAAALNAVSNHLVSSSDEKEILNNICKDLCRILSFDRALIFLRDDVEKYLEYRAGFLGESELSELLEKTRFQVDIASDDTTKISNIYRYKSPILIKNVKEHLSSLNPESRAVLEFSKSQSFLAVPIYSETESFGVLLADNFTSARRLTSEDLAVLSTVGRQIGVVLQKIRALNRLAVAYDEIERLAASYSRFVPFRLIDLIGFKSVVDVHLKAGREYEMAIVFSDIRGFTGMSERMPPTESVAFLNSYFSSLAPIFENHGGIIDKFLGDGIMALFLEPTKAIEAAVDFQRQLVVYNQTNRSGSKRAFVASGIGIHFGRVLLGAVGYENRMSISVTSDSVNLASRIDGLNKKFGVEMLCSAEMVSRLPDQSMVRFVGRIKVDGRQSMTDVFEIIGHYDKDSARERKAAEPLIREIADLREVERFEEAAVLVETAMDRFPNDPVIIYYKKEVREMQRQSPLKRVG